MWENGRATDYLNWAPGEPNDQDGSQNCVRMYQASGQWDDYFCYEYYYLGYVCQTRQDLFKKGTSTTTWATSARRVRTSSRKV